MKMESTYEITKARSGYSIKFNGVEIGACLELHEAVTMIETLLRGDANE